LQDGPNAQKQGIEPFENPKSRAALRNKPKRTQERDASPHRSERCRTRKKRTTLLSGVKPRQELGAIKRTIARLAGHVHELNRASRIEAPDE